MCRWLAYLVEPITPYRFLYEEYSLIEQSHHACKSKTVVNGDGLGWYRVANGWIVDSEPLDSDKAKWQPIPRNHTTIIDRYTSEPTVIPL